MKTISLFSLKFIPDNSVPFEIQSRDGIGYVVLEHTLDREIVSNYDFTVTVRDKDGKQVIFYSLNVRLEQLIPNKQYMKMFINLSCILFTVKQIRHILQVVHGSE